MQIYINEKIKICILWLIPIRFDWVKPSCQPVEIIAHLPTNVTSQNNRYFQVKCSKQRHSFVPPIQTVTDRTGVATTTRLYHPHFLRIPLVRRVFHCKCFFPRTDTLWMLPRTLSILTSSSLGSIIVYPSYSQLSLLNSSSCVHITHLNH